MEKIKFKVKSKQLDGSTEVSDMTISDDNEVSSENSVEPAPGPGPTPTGGFSGQLTEDNLLFECIVGSGYGYTLVNGDNFFNHIPSDFTENHLVILSFSSDGWEHPKIAIGHLNNYDGSDPDYPNIEIITAFPTYFENEEQGHYMNIDRVAILKVYDPDELQFNISGGYDGGWWENLLSNYWDWNYEVDVKVYLLK